MSEQIPYNSNNEQQVSKRKTKFEKQVDRDRDRIRRAMSTYDARWLIYMIIERAGIHSKCFMAGMSDVTAFNEGGRELGLFAYEQIMDACPDLFALAQKEFNQKEQIEEK